MLADGGLHSQQQVTHRRSDQVAGSRSHLERPGMTEAAAHVTSRRQGGTQMMVLPANLYPTPRDGDKLCCPVTCRRWCSSQMTSAPPMPRLRWMGMQCVAAWWRLSPGQPDLISSAIKHDSLLSHDLHLRTWCQTCALSTFNLSCNSGKRLQQPSQQHCLGAVLLPCSLSVQCLATLV